jgi:hypothetical protein
VLDGEAVETLIPVGLQEVGDLTLRKSVPVLVVEKLDGDPS